MAYKTRAGETQYQARQRIARAKGFRTYREYRTSSPQARERATEALIRRDEGYGRSARSAARVIRTRARQEVETGAGRVLTTGSVERVRRFIGVQPSGAELSWRVVVRVRGGEFDRRRRDKRRGRGRETGFRVITWTDRAQVWTADDREAFGDELDQEIQGELDRLYSGYHDWTPDTIAIVARGSRAA